MSQLCVIHFRVLNNIGYSRNVFKNKFVILMNNEILF